LKSTSVDGPGEAERDGGRRLGVDREIGGHLPAKATIVSEDDYIDRSGLPEAR
jgi:hypothetical protein